MVSLIFHPISEIKGFLINLLLRYPTKISNSTLQLVHARKTVEMAVSIVTIKFVNARYLI